MSTKTLMLDLARTMVNLGKPFTLHALIVDGSKEGNDPMTRLHNHAVKESCYELLDEGKIKLDDKGNVSIA